MYQETNKVCDHIKKFELEINAHVKHPLVVNIYYDFDQDIPINIKFVRFQNKIVHKNDLKCEGHRHQKGAWANDRVRFYVDQVPEDVKPFSMYIWPCTRCGLIHRAQFLTYKTDPRKLPKVANIGKILKSKRKTKKLESTIPSGIHRVIIEGS